MKYLFTSESVTEGHPDKVSDAISDGILDAILAQDPKARVALETAVKSNFVLLFGEVTTTAKVDYEQVARDVVKKIGYTNPNSNFSYDTFRVEIQINQQSSDIALGVDSTENKEQGAGDQGIMFGYASNETDSKMPLAIDLAHKLAQRLAYVRKNSIIKDLGPDGKTQVTVIYDENHKVVGIDSVVLSTQHADTKDLETLKKEVKEHIFNVVIDPNLLSETTKYYINPTGRFVIGGPEGDSGLTGRKIIVDTYGGYARHGGGAFSGKDASKVDRSAAYMARYLAKNIVASGIADKCEIQLAYAIGVARPVSIYLDTFNTEKVDKMLILETIKNNFDLSPNGIITYLDLLKPVYSKTSAYGHFGKENEGFTWENTNKIDLFKSLM